MPHGARTSPGSTNRVNGEEFHCVDGAAGNLNRSIRKKKRGYYTISYPKRNKHGSRAAVQRREPPQGNAKSVNTLSRQLRQPVNWIPKKKQKKNLKYQ
eukprot:5910778-Ditylum_brightwellii.AAC.1